MKKIYILLLLLLVLGCMGCEQADYSIQLKQPVGEISSITFVDNLEEARPVIILEIKLDSQIEEVVADMKNLEVGRFRNDPPTSYGYLYIKVCYQNGDIEIIGTSTFKYNSVDGKIDEKYGGWYYVDLDSMRELFLKYSSRTEDGYLLP